MENAWPEPALLWRWNAATSWTLGLEIATKCNWANEKIDKIILELVYKIVNMTTHRLINCVQHSFYFFSGFGPWSLWRFPRLQSNDVQWVGRCPGGGAGHARHGAGPGPRQHQPRVRSGASGPWDGAGPPSPLQRLLSPRLHAARYPGELSEIFQWNPFANVSMCLS